MFMRTDRLFLRPVFPEDWREIYRGIADYGVVRMLARAPWPYGPADAITYCRTPAPAKAMKFAITLPEVDGAPIIGLIGIEPDEEGHELGYWIGRKWQRRGYAGEAVQGVLTMAAALGLQQINAGHYLENAASGKVLKTNGFVETGEIRPTVCAAREGEVILARRYICDLAQNVALHGAQAA